jgi:hypothetical protein
VLTPWTGKTTTVEYKKKYLNIKRNKRTRRISKEIPKKQRNAKLWKNRKTKLRKQGPTKKAKIGKNRGRTLHKQTPNSGIVLFAGVSRRMAPKHPLENEKVAT